MHATWNKIPCKTILKFKSCCVFADGIINLHWKRVINFFGKNDVIDVVGNSSNKQTEKKHYVQLILFCWHGILCGKVYLVTKRTLYGGWPTEKKGLCLGIMVIRSAI